MKIRWWEVETGPHKGRLGISGPLRKAKVVDSSPNWRGFVGWTLDEVTERMRAAHGWSAWGPVKQPEQKMLF